MALFCLDSRNPLQLVSASTRLSHAKTGLCAVQIHSFEGLRADLLAVMGLRDDCEISGQRMEGFRYRVGPWMKQAVFRAFAYNGFSEEVFLLWFGIAIIHCTMLNLAPWPKMDRSIVKMCSL